MSAAALPKIVSLPLPPSITTFVPVIVMPRRSSTLALLSPRMRTVPVAPLPSITSIPDSAALKLPATPMSTLPVPTATMRSTPVVPLSRQVSWLWKLDQPPASLPVTR